MVKKLLWLDDSRDPFTSDWLVFSPIKHPFQTFWVQSYVDFVDWIEKNGAPDAVCFDFDLGTEKNGYNAATWLVGYCMKNNIYLPVFTSQSAEPDKRDKILRYLDNAKIHISMNVT